MYIHVHVHVRALLTNTHPAQNKIIILPQFHHYSSALGWTMISIPSVCDEHMQDSLPSTTHCQFSGVRALSGPITFYSYM